MDMKKTKIFNGKRYTLLKQFVGETGAKMRRDTVAVTHPTWKQEIYRDEALRVGLYVLKPKTKRPAPKKKAKNTTKPKCKVVKVEAHTRKCPTKKRGKK